MIIKFVSAILILITGFLAGLAAIAILFGIAGGDIWHQDFLSSYWWIAPVLVFILDVVIVMLIPKFLPIHFATLDYILFLVVPYVLGLGIFLVSIQ